MTGPTSILVSIHNLKEKIQQQFTLYMEYCNNKTINKNTLCEIVQGYMYNLVFSHTIIVFKRSTCIRCSCPTLATSRPFKTTIVSESAVYKDSMLYESNSK